MSPATRRFIAVLVSIIVVLGVLFALASSRDPRSAAPQSRAPYTITGANGTINVPSTMHIDAFDPATNSTIDAVNVWGEANHPSGVRPVCSLEDGDAVNVDNTSGTGATIWVHITAGNCNGWVLSEFITR
jgi:hypothetical protein